MTTTIGNITALKDPVPEANRNTTDYCPPKYLQVPVKQDDRVTLQNHTVNYQLIKIDSVLQASAVIFSDDWPQDFRDVRFSGNNDAVKSQWQSLRQKNSFASGEKGVWRPRKFFTYLDDRKQSPGLRIDKDGAFDAVPLFDWYNPVFLECAPKWKLTNEITKYSPYAFELENRDILDRYSSALYGYRGAVTTAVAANTEYFEMGYESFEEYKPGERFNWYGLSTGNLDIFTESSLDIVTLYELYEVIMGNGFLAIIENPDAGSDMNKAKINSTSRKWSNGEASYFKSRFYDIPELLPIRRGPGGSHRVIRLDEEGGIPGLLEVFNYDGDDEFEDEYWTGSVQLPNIIEISSSTANHVSITNDKAHTGKNSLKVEMGASFKQHRLRLIPGENYVFSAWVSKDSTNVPTFEAQDNQAENLLKVLISFVDHDGSQIGSPVTMEPDGPVIEGWQQISGFLNVPDNTLNIKLIFLTGFRFAGGGEPDEVIVDGWGNITENIVLDDLIRIGEESEECFGSA